MPDSLVSAGALSARDLKSGLLGAGAYLEHNYRLLDNLNVFPVPDGDTGTNMLATYRAGMTGLEGAESMRELAEAMHEPMTRQSRGNSGFILARFFHGFFEVVGHSEILDVARLREAFSRGSYLVNTSLFAPVEGTMITVIATIAASMRETGETSVERALEAAREHGRQALFETPRLLQILARAGVVDAGALGFLFIVDGFLCGLSDREPAAESESDYRFTPDTSVPATPQGSEAMHRFCTEVTLRTNDAGSVESGHSSELAGFLRANGSSIALVDEDDLIKVHIHTDHPDLIKEYLGALGSIEFEKIEDMRDQMGLVAVEEDPESNNTLIACVPGDGFAEMFTSLGVERCIVYDDQLPNAARLMEEIDLSASSNVIVLPNNKNILPTAMLARDRSDRNVSILPTESVVQGLAAIYGFSENVTMRENVSSMSECMELVETVSLYRSVADTEFGGRRISSGDYFCIHGGEVLSVDTQPVEAAAAGLMACDLRRFCNVCIYASDTESMERAEALSARLAGEHPDLEIECLHGGQSREYLIISME